MNYSFKTISKKVMGDLHTPESIYLKLGLPRKRE